MKKKSFPVIEGAETMVAVIVVLAVVLQWMVTNTVQIK